MVRRISFPTVIIALFLSWISAGASEPAQGERTSILLISVDTLRADRLSGYGYERPTSPRIDELLARGIRFENARTVEPLTSPALCSLLTGLDPHQHASTRNGLRMQEGLGSLPKSLAAHGWRTAAFVGNWTLKTKLSRLGEHFQHYEGIFSRRRWFGLFNAEAEAGDVTDQALDWLDDHADCCSDRPYMVWVHYVEPHAPYRFHPEHAESLGLPEKDPTRSDRYDTEVAFVDAEIGRLLDEIQRRSSRSPLVVFVSDHGESLGEHGYWGHGRHLYEPCLRVPMGITWPDRLRPGVAPEPTLITDLAPTVLDLLGLPPLPTGSGISLAPLLQGSVIPTDRCPCYQAHRGAVQFDHDSRNARTLGLLEVGIVQDQRKEILDLRNNRLEIYDLAADPEEIRNLATRDAEPSRELLGCKNQIIQGLHGADQLGDEPDLDPESQERLRALGYLQ